MAPRFQLVGYDEKETQDESNANSVISAIFSDNRSDSDSNSDLELDSEDSGLDSDLGDYSFDNKAQLPLEHYVAKAETLDALQL